MTAAVRPSHMLALTLLLAGLSACASAPSEEASGPLGRVADPRLPTEHYQAQAVESPQEIRLAVHAQGLSANQANALARFVQTWSDGEGGVITLSAPTGGPDGAAAFRTGEGARTFLIAQGVPADRIQVTGYDPAGQPEAPLRIGYTRYEAVIPACGREWQNLASTKTNDVSSNFGCAITANMAAQIANPGDLLRPRDMTPADAARRATVLEKYRKGQVVSSEKDAQAQGVVSDAIK
ncbi:CpaD family pilus assembly protein [Phenylobacterium aquaticum]|uniref:CpaD family pilus assembly protein n=1 Tax=Phenylobacterium aquaticum TaxID=1763816 RepID=UPI001F5E12C4|nr:CpaD family pilus assembly protein [Phenylobacterium aquaticum]MCI3135359.1 CpaD family pilus assembly protein [Phenylobacterium aquaticum]